MQVTQHFFQRIEIAGLKYGFDLSAAQYFNARTIMPWDEYEQTLGVEIEMVKDRGKELEDANAMCDTMIRESLAAFHVRYEAQAYLARQVLGIKVEDTIFTWLKGKKLGLSELIREGQNGFN